MRKCERCGAPNPNHMAVCYSCGAKLGAADQDLPKLDNQDQTLNESMTELTAKGASRTLSVHELPPQQQNMLMPGETPYQFAYIAAKGGCATSTQANQWIMVTDRRILFEASVKETSGQYKHQSGSIPMSKISYVGTITEQDTQGCGCSGAEVTRLVVNSGGGSITIAVPTQIEAQRTKAIIDDLLSKSSEP